MSSETIDLFVNEELTMDLALDLEEYFSQQWDPAKPAPAAPPAAAAPAFAPVGVKREREEEEDMAGWPFKTLRLEEGAKGWASAAPCHEEEEDEEEDEEGSLFGDSESLSPNHLHTPGAGADRMVPHYTLGQGGIPTMDQMVAMPLKELNQIRKVITLSQEDAKILRCRRKRLKNKEAATRSRNRKESQLEALSRQVRELTERCQQQEQTISTLQRRTEVLQHQLRAKEGPAAQRE